MTRIVIDINYIHWFKGVSFSVESKWERSYFSLSVKPAYLENLFHPLTWRICLLNPLTWSTYLLNPLTWRMCLLNPLTWKTCYRLSAKKKRKKKSATVVTTRHRCTLKFKFSEFSFEIKIYLCLFSLRIINVFLLHRIIIKPWLDIMRFVVVSWASQFHVQHFTHFWRCHGNHASNSM